MRRRTDVCPPHTNALPYQVPTTDDVADLYTYNGNMYSQLHVNSDAANSGPSLSAITWTSANWPLAGVADYGVYAINNTSLTQTQCDIASTACVKMGIQSGANNPGQITDTQMKCGAFVNVPPTYYGIEIPANATQESVQGTVAPGKCNVPAIQLIHVDSTLDPSVSICNNSNATVAACGAGQSGFAAGQYYTQIGSAAYGSTTLAANTLYAMPFIARSGAQFPKCRSIFRQQPADRPHSSARWASITHPGGRRPHSTSTRVRRPSPACSPAQRRSRYRAPIFS